MSDASGITVTDVLGFAKGTLKLLDTIALGVGKVYEPWHIQRMAKAKAKEIEIISDKINENFSLPIRYDNGEVYINAEDANQLAMRAQNRAFYQEMRKQQNIENVITKAYSKMEHVSDVSDKPVDPDWVNSFFDSVANVSNEQMQTLWAKLLAGEVETPGAFSLRTLNTLKNMSQLDAELFSQIVPFILCLKKGDAYQHFVFADPETLSRNSIPFGAIIALNDAGLMYSGQVQINIKLSCNMDVIISNASKNIRIKSNNAQDITLAYPIYPLTEAGGELYNIVKGSNPMDSKHYLSTCCDVLKKRGFGDFHINPPPDTVSVSIE